MLKEVSSGGVVIFGNAILMLRKYNGDWVLPKGRVEAGERLHTAALREVLEESRVKAEIIQYIGRASYHYTNIQEDELVFKTVHWYLMKSQNMYCKPQKKEGFIDAKYIHINKAKDIIRYEDEKKMIKKGLKIIGMA